MKALQFHVTIAVPDGFYPPDAPAESLAGVIKGNLSKVLTDPGAIFARKVPACAEVHVTEETK